MAADRRGGCRWRGDMSASSRPFDAEWPPRVDVEESSRSKQRERWWGAEPVVPQAVGTNNGARNKHG